MDDDYRTIDKFIAERDMALWPDYFVNPGRHEVTVKIQGHDDIIVPPGEMRELPKPAK